MEEFEQEIIKIRDEIKNRKNKLIYMKCKTFLKKFNIKRRVPYKIEEIEKILDKYNIVIYSKEGWSLLNMPFEETITFKLPTVSYAGTIEVAKGDNPRELYPHQVEAVRQLDTHIIQKNKSTFEGLVVLPTGGGKTLTAVQWILKNYIDRDKKVLWIAHRHELLEQAQATFVNNAYANILKNRKTFNYRIISGLHDKPVNIKETDDLIIASKDSLNSGLSYLLENWVSACNGEIFLVIDEAHHATARTYRKLINALKSSVQSFKMLGLTATPFRTIESEQGLLKKVFPDDIIYKIDLRTLVNRGILSEPIYEEMKTGVDMTDIFTDADIMKIQSFDIDSIGKDIAKGIGENKTRNNRIVMHYLENKDKYKQTIVFALNVDNAIALNAVFNEEKIPCDYVVSAIRDAATGVTISARDNKEKIERFRKGALKVLINVNILTEGTDIPNVQSIFLTRPTISAILMTQMIGRGLRGERAGGTKNAYIVSFVDEWKDKIAWVNPEKLMIDENTNFSECTPETKQRMLRLISMSKIEEFAIMMDNLVSTEGLENLDFIERVPVGLYSFSILIPSDNGEENEKNCDVIVYDNIKQAYMQFINDLSKIININDNEVLTQEKLHILSKKVEEEYFYGYEKLPGYRIEDIKDIILCYYTKEHKPQFIEFGERDKYDIEKISKEIWDKDLGQKAKAEYINKLWEDENCYWKAFFGYDLRYFQNEIDLALRKISNPEIYKKSEILPMDIKEQRDLEKLSMWELREKAPEYWRSLVDKIFEKSKDANGNYTCASTGYKSNHKIDFQIDHIIPISKGGLTTLDNLQILEKNENMRQGNRK